jgi:hypothetical protein
MAMKPDIVDVLVVTANVAPANEMTRLNDACRKLLRDAADEIGRLRASVERKQQQYERGQRCWVEAAQKALKGDTEHLRLRVDMALSGPIEMTETKE